MSALSMAALGQSDKLSLSDRLLLHLDQYGELDTYKFAISIDEDHQKVVGAVKCLQALDGVITAEPYSIVRWTLTEEGKHVAQYGSHEAMVYGAIPPQGVMKEIFIKEVPPEIHTIGLSKAMAHGWIFIEKVNGKPLLRRKVENIKDFVKDQLVSFAKDPACIGSKVKTDYKKRKLIQEITTKSFKLGKGENFAVTISKPETDLTPEMIASGSWKELTFKPYNFNALGVQPDSGALHPLLKVRAEFRQIFLEMGFTEMPTNNYVESSFWNFDALFQPQQHPARDAHDTFFVAEPKSTTTFPAKYLEQVKQVHSTGGFGSQGYGYEWKIEEAEKNLLRTHTTAVSARMLYNLAQNGFRPAKYFSIDRVFRNETLDATHLAEFHQVEGVVADYKLTLGDLIGTLHEFFNKLGLKSLHFKPAYNPYTEPSMEIFSFHPGLNKFIEVGNSGIFRPEMLLPMGLPADVNVIAWGLSLERPTMIKYGINNIRTLVGPKVDLEMVHASPLCRLEKIDSTKTEVLDALKDRQDAVISKLQDLEKSLPTQEKNDGATRTEIVIFANPQDPPFSVIVLLKLLGSNCVSGHIQVHSSVLSVPPFIGNIVKDIFKATGKSKLNIKFTWHAALKTPRLAVYPSTQHIIGEVNIARYLNHWVEKQSNPPLIHKGGGAILSVRIDSWLDLLHGSMVFGDEKSKTVALHEVNSVLRQSAWLVDSQPTIADLCWWSVLKNMPPTELAPNLDSLKQWFKRCNEHKLFALE